MVYSTTMAGDPGWQQLHRISYTLRIIPHNIITVFNCYKLAIKSLCVKFRGQWPATSWTETVIMFNGVEESVNSSVFEYR